MTDTVNVFSALAKYGSTESEDYLTVAFAFLRNMLLERDRSAGVGLLTALCADDGLSFGEAEDITVRGCPQTLD